MVVECRFIVMTSEVTVCIHLEEYSGLLLKKLIMHANTRRHFTVHCSLTSYLVRKHFSVGFIMQRKNLVQALKLKTLLVPICVAKILNHELWQLDFFLVSID